MMVSSVLKGLKRADIQLGFCSLASVMGETHGLFLLGTGLLLQNPCCVSKLGHPL